MNEPKIGFIGLGLIGGSLAKTIRRKLPQSTIIAYEPNEDSLKAACLDGTVQISCHNIDKNFTDCDYIFLCAPVRANTDCLAQLKALLPADTDCIITDVGSIKSDIQVAVKQQGMEANFIGGHPMAGLELSGYAHANAYLFENVYYILTPGEQVPEKKTRQFVSLLTQLDVIPIVLSAREHDYATACVSHLPHIISAGLVNLVKDSDWDNQVMKSIAAGGFKDITRISSSSAGMWKQICLGNKEQILPVLHSYISSLSDIYRIIENDDEEKLTDFFESAKNYRDSIADTTGGALLKSYCIYSDLRDETGQLATVATLLAAHGISIKNIGIIHNREFEQGVLKIEFYDGQTFEKARTVLTNAGYHIYERK